MAIAGLLRFWIKPKMKARLARQNNHKRGTDRMFFSNLNQLKKMQLKNSTEYLLLFQIQLQNGYERENENLFVLMPDRHFLFQSMKRKQKSKFKLSYPPTSSAIPPTHNPSETPLAFVSLPPARNLNGLHTTLM